MVKPSNKRRTNEVKSADVSIGDLYNKYVKTIDSFRSLANPPSYDNSTTVKPRNPKMASRYNGGKDQNALEYQESRAHAFYRMIGFPIVTKSTFYNPGFDPTNKEPLRYNDIDAAFFKDYPDLAKIMADREKLFKAKINIFRNKDILSSIYASILPISNKFNFIGHDPGDPLKPQAQTVTSTERIQYLRDNQYPLTDSQSAKQSKYVSCTTHILKPFIIHPQISNAVIPGERTIAVPFPQNDTDVNMSDTKSASKCILELIITARLSGSKLSDNTKGVADRVLKSKTLPTDEGTVVIAQALGGELDFDKLKKDNALMNSIMGYNDVEQEIIQMFTDSIKSVVKQLKFAIDTWNKNNTETRVQPIPNTFGPEFGGVSKVSLDSPSNIDVSIAYLQLKQALAEGTTQINLSGFAQSSGLDGALATNQTSELDKLISKRDDSVNNAMKALKNIEIITGEISGLGLIDILAIQLALWSIDIKYLLGFLDSEAIQRCHEYNHGQLVNDELANQISGTRPSITECLQQFEKLFFNILSFADSVSDNEIHTLTYTS